MTDLLDMPPVDRFLLQARHITQWRTEPDPALFARLMKDFEYDCFDASLADRMRAVKVLREITGTE